MLHLNNFPHKTSFTLISDLHNLPMKISIITVTFNSSSTLRDTIDSVLRQSYQDIEYIIVDGNSKDGTVDIIKEYEPKFHGNFHWISEPDNGLYEAMNKGIRMATGDVIGILNSDDFYHNKNSVTIVAEALVKYKTDSVFADIRFVDPLDTNKTVRYYSSKRFSTKCFRIGYMPAHPTFFTYRKFFEEFGCYETDYAIAADYELLVRFLHVHKLTFKYLPFDMIKMRKGGKSTASIRHKLKFDSEIVRACKSNGIYTNSLIVLLRGFIKISEYFHLNKKKDSQDASHFQVEKVS